MKTVKRIMTTRRLRRKRMGVPLSALLVLVASCGGGDSDAPPSEADVDRAVDAVKRAVQDQDARSALACDIGDVEEVSWTTEETAVISSTVAGAVAYVLQDEIWSSFELPGGRRDALVEHAVEIGQGMNVPVLVDRALRVMLGIEARDGGYTSAGAVKCL
jgi:hypothetical protein